MKMGGKLHKLWFKWTRNAYLCDYLWPWRVVCWFTEHDLSWNYGRTYCVFCGKTISKDQWRIDRDKRRCADE